MGVLTREILEFGLMDADMFVKVSFFVLKNIFSGKIFQFSICW